MLFTATSINYMDRQVIAILKPTLEHSIGLTEAEYGYIVDAFQLAYAIGVAEPVSVLIDTFDTGLIDDDKISEIVRAHFKLTPKAIIETLDLRRPIYKKTAAFGHFGRTEDTFSWEATDKAHALKEAAQPAGAARS